MNLCIDVGNTSIGVGVFYNDKLIKKIRLTTGLEHTEDEYFTVIKRRLEDNDIKINKIQHIILSSVVPSVNVPLKNALKRIFNVDVISIQPGVKTGLMLKTDNPSEIGNDLIADLVGAKEEYGYPILIADLGTASKILLLDNKGVFTSCLIMPGLTLSANSLISKAALLPEVSLEAPKSILASNTIEAMNAGIVYGHLEMILGLINRYENELGYPCKHIITGGNSVFIKDLLPKDYIYDEDICLKGLNHIINRNINK
ncbi:MAG: type III pantothenate kinase [Bacilli bacterium]|nr:type III pantothenate kinase [Bacilli bacterium]